MGTEHVSGENNTDLLCLLTCKELRLLWEDDAVFELPDFKHFAPQLFHIFSWKYEIWIWMNIEYIFSWNMMVTYSKLLSQELVSNLLFLVSCSAAEVGKQLLPVGFVFSLDNITNIDTVVLTVYFFLLVYSFFFVTHAAYCERHLGLYKKRGNWGKGGKLNYKTSISASTHLNLSWYTWIPNLFSLLF